MTLQRSIIRAKAQQLLQASGIVPAANIKRARSWPTQPKDLPCILIFTRSDNQENDGFTADPTFSATPTIDFEIGVRGDNAELIEDDLDAKCEQLIGLLMHDPDFIFLSERVVSIKTTMEEHEGEFQYSRARISFAFEYSEVYPPFIPNLLTLIDAKVDGRQPFDPAHPSLVAEIKIEPQA